MAVTEQAVRAPAYQVLANELRDQITSGKLRPGERLPAEPELCQRTGLSRSTVREALRLLASQHLIVTTRGVTGGSFVAQPNAQKISDSLSTGMLLLLNAAEVTVPQLIEMRRILEVPAAGLAAERRTEAHLTALAAAAAFDEEADDAETLVRRHQEFHSTIAAATGNTLFEVVTQPLYRIKNGQDIKDAAPPGYWQHLTVDHQELLEFITTQDAAGAMAVARRHLDYIAEVF